MKRKKELRQVYILPAEKRKDSLLSFVNDVWFPLQVCNENDNQTTVTFYGNMKKLVVEYFMGLFYRRLTQYRFNNSLPI